MRYASRFTAMCSIILLSLCALVSAARIDDLVAALAGENEQARAQARQVLSRESVEVVPKLAALLADEKEVVRLTAFNVLADFASQVSVPGREDDRRAVTADFLKLLGDEQSPRVREFSLRLLPLVLPEGADVSPIAALLNDTAWEEKARAALVETGTSEARAALCNHLEKAEPRMQVALLNGLGQLKDAESLDKILACTQSRDPGVRAAAARALAWTGDPVYLTVIKILMNDDRAVDRKEIVDTWLRLVAAMQRKDDHRDVAAGEYQLMLKSDDATLRMAALAGLGRIDDGSRVGSMLAAMDHPDPRIWAGGLEAFRYMRSETAIRELVQAYPNLPAATQLALLPILGDKKHPLVLPVLTRAASGGDAAMRLASIRALGECSLPGGVAPLAAIMSDAEESEKAEARLALLRLADSLRGREPAETVGRIYLAVFKATPPTDQGSRRAALAGLAAVPSGEAFEVAKAVAADADYADLAIPLLIGTADRLVELKANDKAIELYERAVELRPAHPMLLAVANKLRQLGKPVDLTGKLGVVTNWWVVGPFELGEQNANWDKALIGEPDIDLTARYMAGKRRLDWKRVTAEPEQGYVDLLAQLGPGESCLAYAYAEIELAEATDAILRVGVDDSERIWINGQQVHNVFVARGLTPDQDKVPVKLRKGPNTILMKVWQHNLGWGFCMRITTPDARPLIFSQKGP